MTTDARGPIGCWLAVVLPLSLLLAACAGGDHPQVQVREQAIGESAAAGDAAALRMSLMQTSTPAASAAVAAQVESAGRLIAHTATLWIDVRELDASLAALTDLAASVGGYVQASNVDGSPDRPQAMIRLRVPSTQFEPAMARLRTLADRVVREESAGQDVTEQYVDLGARLRSQQAVEAQLLALLNRANAVGDVLAVQRELSTTRQEVERLQGRLQVLERSVAEATITVHLHQRIAGRQVAAAWAPGGTFHSATVVLVQVLQVIANTAIVAGVFTPLWAPVAAGLWWHRRRSRAHATGSVPPSS